MADPGKTDSDEPPKPSDEAWSAPVAHPGVEDAKIARRLKIVTILVIVAFVLALIVYLAGDW